ncbi:2'-5' RNA ligase [Gracilibacillus ureilyticus]|uniref:RNA 2',3'-cyclic phosphodiesterase n=1 Tax=Gracilibacillus ureilyticus TaxID=531814 RepID=A0A1H9TFA4_9BACI|nr:RNA 2',3'-cyclic phosphodiesterase [Gracilibacillus ureilyticus]SER95293.1 2'-5' RNA ligase [Gracilibacillus ureilyticus]
MPQNVPHYFIAISIDEQTKKHLASIKETLQDKELPFKIWTHEKDLHITLQFLGAVDQKKMNELIQILRKVEKKPVFPVKIGGLRTFGNPEKPRVLWVDVEKTTEIGHLHKVITELCLEVDLPVDKRNYQPHITLAKRWQNKNMILDKNIFDSPKLGKLMIKEVAIYKINPGNTVKYEPVAVYRLQE